MKKHPALAAAMSSADIRQLLTRFTLHWDVALVHSLLADQSSCITFAPLGANDEQHEPNTPQVRLTPVPCVVAKARVAAQINALLKAPLPTLLWHSIHGRADSIPLDSRPTTRLTSDRLEQADQDAEEHQP